MGRLLEDHMLMLFLPMLSAPLQADVSVEPFHLFRYLHEQAYRYHNRKDDNGNKLTDGDRFAMAVRQIVGKRLTWDRLTGKEVDERASLN
jgi:hypothetical protein